MLPFLFANATDVRVQWEWSYLSIASFLFSVSRQQRSASRKKNYKDDLHFPVFSEKKTTTDSGYQKNGKCILTDFGRHSIRSWSIFMPGIMTVIFRGPLKPRTLVSCKERRTILQKAYSAQFAKIIEFSWTIICRNVQMSQLVSIKRFEYAKTCKLSHFQLQGNVFLKRKYSSEGVKNTYKMLASCGTFELIRI